MPDPMNPVKQGQAPVSSSSNPANVGKANKTDKKVSKLQRFFKDKTAGVKKDFSAFKVKVSNKLSKSSEKDLVESQKAEEQAVNNLERKNSQVGGVSNEDIGENPVVNDQKNAPADEVNESEVVVSDNKMDPEAIENNTENQAVAASQPKPAWYQKDAFHYTIIAAVIGLAAALTILNLHTGQVTDVIPWDVIGSVGYFGGYLCWAKYQHNQLPDAVKYASAEDVDQDSSFEATKEQAKQIGKDAVMALWPILKGLALALL